MLKKLLAILSVYLFTLTCGEIHKSELGAYRLSDDTYPENYEVDLTFANFDDFLTYNGINTIKIKVLQDTDLIILHSSVLNVTRVRHMQEAGNVRLNYTQDHDQELLIIESPKNEIFKTDTSITIEIRFIGAINEFPTTQGVYRGFYVDKNSAKHYFMASYLQPNFARKVFPCYDESRFESTFKLTVTHQNKYQAVSNMDKFTDEDITLAPMIYTRTFEQTSSIPAHLLTFLISDLVLSNQIEIIQNGIKIRGLSQPSLVDRINFGILTTIQAFKSIEEYFGTTYALNSLDLVIVPHFDFDDTRYPGIIFYREDSFLYDKHEDTAYTKEVVSRNIFNKICQTFITSSFAVDSESTQWLNKGLCKFYEYHLTNSVIKDMKLNEIFAVEILQPELSRDSSPATPPMTLNVDASYNKAASVIRMFLHGLSEETFKRGLQIYINNSSSNPEEILKPKDFYDALQLAVNDSSIQIAKMFQTWVDQPGHPIVFVTRNYNGNNVKFSQKRFTDLIKNGTTYYERWDVPISYSLKSMPNSNQFWLNQSEMELNVEGLKTSDYFIANVDQTGYYRVMYDETNWITIAKALYEQDFKDISPNTRAMLIDDAGKFMEAEILEMNIFLELIKYLKHEVDYVPWMSATNNLLYMRRMLNDGSSKLYSDFQKFLQTLLTKVFETYGVKDKADYDHHQKHMRNLAINWACQAHLPACLSQTAELFNQGIMNSDVAVPPDHRATIMCNGAITGNFTTYRFLWESYENAVQPSERMLILKSIGCIEDQEILKEYIRRYSEAKDDEWVTVIQSVYLNGPIGLKVAIEFLDEKSTEFGDFIYKHNAADSLDLIFQEIADQIVTDEMYTNFTKLMDKYRLTSNEKALLHAIVDKNLEWIEKNAPIIDKFLNSSSIVAVSLTAILFGFFVQYFVR